MHLGIRDCFEKLGYQLRKHRPSPIALDVSSRAKSAVSLLSL
jgi:hypothetical protein